MTYRSETRAPPPRGAHLCDAYERILALWTEQTAQRARLEAEVGRRWTTLERWYKADETPGFAAAEAELLALCAELFGENSSESRGEKA